MRAAASPQVDRPSSRREHLLDALAVLGCFAYAFAAWWPTRELPYYWDGLDLAVRAARAFRYEGVLPLVIRGCESAFAHPPGFPLVLAAAWRVLGDSLLVTHVVLLAYATLFLAGAYFAGRGLAGRLVGVGAALVVGGFPVFLAEVGDVYLDLPAAALVTGALGAWLCERRKTASALFLAAAMTKLPSVLVPMSLSLGVALRAWSTTRGEAIGTRLPRAIRLTLREAAPLLAAFVWIPVWLCYHHAVEGWWLSRPTRAGTPLSGGRVMHDVGAVAVEILLRQYRFVLVGGAALAYFAARLRNRRVELAPIAPLLLALVAAISFFGVFGEFGMRYALFVLPCYALAALYVARRSFASPLAPLGIVVGAFGASCFAWFPPSAPDRTFVVRPADDLGYLDMIAIDRRVARFLEDRYPRAQVVGSFPESQALTLAFAGYVRAPLDFVSCSDFAPRSDVTQVVVLHGYAFEQHRCQRLVDAVGARRVRGFRSHAKWLEVYEVPRRASD